MATTPRAHLTAGQTAIQLHPSTGRIIRRVKILELKGDTAIVRALNGPTRDMEYSIECSILHSASGASS